MDSSKTTIRHVSHCFGYGGIDLALKRIFGARIVTIAACEIEAYAVANGISKAEQGLLDVDLPFWTDLKSFPFGQFHGLVDIYSSGFPCQPFSCAGKQEADNDPRHLWPHIRDGIERMQPDWVFFENVRALITAKLKGKGWSDPEGTPVLLHILRELERIGYESEPGIFSAAEVGATHRRQRVFILGRRRGARQLAFTTGERSREARRDQRRPEEWTAGAGNQRDVAHSEHDAGCPERGTKSRKRTITGPDNDAEPREDGNGRMVGNSAGNDERRTSEPTMHGEREQVGGSSGRMGVGLADSHNEGLEIGRCFTGNDGQEQPTIERSGLPAFPPGPKDADGWARVLAIRPDLAPAVAKPALCRVVDGNPRRLVPSDSRIDQLRACGNGVVPATAAKAFVTLYAKLENHRPTH